MGQNTLEISELKNELGDLYPSVFPEGVRLIAARELFDNFKRVQHNLSFAY
jgi:hypothetical protein